MSDAERCSMIMLFDKLRPECAIEAPGTADGGSLSMISRYAKKVYSLDIDPTCKERFHSRFPNAEFVVGDSRKTLPICFEHCRLPMRSSRSAPIHGLHTFAGVKADIENLLAYVPTCPLYVALHDSFNPDCRSGMAAADGIQSIRSLPIARFRLAASSTVSRLTARENMWCGLALALMLPERAKGTRS